MAMIPSRYPIKLLTVGNGALKSSMLEKSKNLSVSDRIVMVDSTESAQEYYSALDLLVMPSLYEGLSMTSLEAQASGLDCFFSDRIDQSINIGDNRYIKLEAREWAKQIIEYSKQSRKKRNSKQRKFVELELDAKSGYNNLKRFYDTNQRKRQSKVMSHQACRERA